MQLWNSSAATMSLKMPPIWLHCKTSTQGQAVHMRAFPNQVLYSAPGLARPVGKILVTSARTIVLKHHLILSMSSRDLNWILVVETVTNLQLLKNVLKRSWLSDYSNLWDSGLSGRSLAVNGRCSGSECSERYRLYCVRHVCGRYQRSLHACGGCRLYEQIQKHRGSSECSVCFISDIKTALYLVKTVWKN